MKTNVRVERFFTLEDISEKQLIRLREGLRLYGEQYSVRETADFMELEQLLSEALNPPQPAPMPAPKLSEDIDTLEKLEMYIKRLKPFGGVLIPAELCPEKYQCNIGEIQFIRGSKNQISISSWLDMQSMENGEAATLKIWLNKHCAEALLDFIQGSSRIAGRQVRKTRTLRDFDYYLDKDGKIDSSKTLEYVHYLSDDSVSIKKDGTTIRLSCQETLFLREFLQYHIREAEHND